MKLFLGCTFGKKMEQSKKEKIELIFRNSDNFDELFDAFRDALKLRIADIDTYKIVIANPCLQHYEMKMLTNEICREFPQICYEINLWAGQIAMNKKGESEWRNASIDFLLTASNAKPADGKPLIGLLELYDHELELPSNEKIIESVKERMKFVTNKKELYLAFAGFYKKEGKTELEKKYKRLAERSQ